MARVSRAPLEPRVPPSRRTSAGNHRAQREDIERTPAAGGRSLNTGREGLSGGTSSGPTIQSCLTFHPPNPKPHPPHNKSHLGLDKELPVLTPLTGGALADSGAPVGCKGESLLPSAVVNDTAFSQTMCYRRSRFSVRPHYRLTRQRPETNEPHLCCASNGTEVSNPLPFLPPTTPPSPPRSQPRSHGLKIIATNLFRGASSRTAGAPLGQKLISWKRVFLANVAVKH